jgi:SAM-dependent methyltransferase
MSEQNRTEQNRTEQEVLKIYQKVNPSTYPIEKDKDVFKQRMDFMKNLFLYRLSFPPKMFKNTTLLEFGTGTGENSLFYLLAGASCTFVEMNPLACRRAGKLFQEYTPELSKYRIVNESLFDFSSQESYDIVISLGVIHHTSNMEKAFELKSNYLKKGGFLVLGVGNVAGGFQRNLQRAIIYHFAKSEEDIVSFAEELFPEHLDRAEKFGGRERKAIIYDTYVNPKIDTPSITNILGWFLRNGLTMYSSWPPIIPAILGDAADRNPLQLEKFPNLMSIAEIVYLSHNEDDADALVEIEKETKMVIAPFKELVDLLSDVSPHRPVAFGDIIGKIDTFHSIGNEINPYALHINRLTDILNETKRIIESLQEGNIDSVKKCIKNTKELFKGSLGLGMNWYIGYKP